MKRIFVVVLALALAAALCACGSPAATTAPASAPATAAAPAASTPPANNIAPSTNPSATTVAGGTASASAAYADIMRSGTFYMECDMVAEGLIIPTKLAYQNGSSAMESIQDGTTSKVVIRDGKLYMGNDADKIVVEQDAVAGAADVPYDDLTFVGSGEDGGMTYEEYTYTDASVGEGGEAANCTLRYYFTGDQLTKLVSITSEGTTEMNIQVLTATIPDGFFDFPADYTAAKLPVASE